MPVMTGILLNTVPPSMRTLANSIANLTYNLIGYLPAPFIYGLVYERTGGEDEESRWGLGAIECASFLSSFFLILVYVLRTASDYK
jgi:MFS family permease